MTAYCDFCLMRQHPSQYTSQTYSLVSGCNILYNVNNINNRIFIKYVRDDIAWKSFRDDSVMKDNEIQFFLHHDVSGILGFEITSRCHKAKIAV